MLCEMPYGWSPPVPKSLRCIFLYLRCWECDSVCDNTERTRIFLNEISTKYCKILVILKTDVVVGPVCTLPHTIPYI